MKNKGKIFAVAPMMDWTDSHCRVFHRTLSRRALLYTEMVVADAVIHGDREQLLGGAAAGPVALQLGGGDPDKLARAVALAVPYGFSEINLNVGCPSDRVQAGTFGACMMKTPELVGECVAAMKSATDIPLTVKCRIGVDKQDTGPALDELAQSVWRAGAEALWVHARKAWLKGLSAKQNREIPPLDYGRVRKLKTDNPNHFIGLNGGLETLNQAIEAIAHAPGLDGAMIGRAAYRQPGMLRFVDRLFYGKTAEPVPFADVIATMADYAEAHLAAGGRLHHITRHMTGLFHGFPGARAWRQTLAIKTAAKSAGPQILFEAFAAVDCEGHGEERAVAKSASTALSQDATFA